MQFSSSWLILLFKIGLVKVYTDFKTVKMYKIYQDKFINKLCVFTSIWKRNKNGKQKTKKNQAKKCARFKKAPNSNENIWKIGLFLF